MKQFKILRMRGGTPRVTHSKVFPPPLSNLVGRKNQIRWGKAMYHTMLLKDGVTQKRTFRQSNRLLDGQKGSTIDFRTDRPQMIERVMYK